MAASARIASTFQLHGQTALVTGGTRGIGQTMTFALAEAGADIILVQVKISWQQTKITVLSEVHLARSHS